MKQESRELIELEQRLAALGVFECGRIAIVGKGMLSEEAALICVSRGLKVFLFSDRRPRKVGGNMNYCALKEATGQNRWSNLEELVLVLSCSKDIFKEILSWVKPFCRIITLGPIYGVIDNIDLYGSVHTKNLELKFLPLKEG